MNTELMKRIEKLGSAAFLTWGGNAELLKAGEECSELAVQCFKRVAGSPTTDENIIDEIADVLVMATRLRKTFGAEKVDARIQYKLNRLETALIKVSKP